MAGEKNPPGRSTPNKTNKPANPNDAFKKAVTSCMRAVSGDPLEVSFANDRPSMSGDTARLPEPSRKMSVRELSITRGLADSMALRRGCHDSKLHRQNAPQGQMGQAIFDAVEQARVETLGARRMPGMVPNLNAMLEDKYHRGQFADITDKADRFLCRL